MDAMLSSRHRTGQARYRRRSGPVPSAVGLAALCGQSCYPRRSGSVPSWSLRQAPPPRLSRSRHTQTRQAPPPRQSKSRQTQKGRNPLEARSGRLTANRAATQAVGAPGAPVAVAGISSGSARTESSVSRSKSVTRSKSGTNRTSSPTCSLRLGSTRVMIEWLPVFT